MERKTWKRSLDGYEDVGLCDGVSEGDAICDLAAYEDTGMEPAEIKQMCALARLNSNIFDNDFGNHIAELIVAEQDGRLLVLPCPFYSEVYALSQVGNEIIHGELRSTNKDYCLIVNLEGNLTSKGKTWHGVQVRMQDVFHTRPEAEAALASAKQVEASAVASDAHKPGGEQDA